MGKAAFSLDRLDRVGFADGMVFQTQALQLFDGIIDIQPRS